MPNAPIVITVHENNDRTCSTEHYTPAACTFQHNLEPIVTTARSRPLSSPLVLHHRSTEAPFLALPYHSAKSSWKSRSVYHINPLRATINKINSFPDPLLVLHQNKPTRQASLPSLSFSKRLVKNKKRISHPIPCERQSINQFIPWSAHNSVNSCATRIEKTKKQSKARNYKNADAQVRWAELGEKARRPCGASHVDDKVKFSHVCELQNRCEGALIHASVVVYLLYYQRRKPAFPGVLWRLISHRPKPSPLPPRPPAIATCFAGFLHHHTRFTVCELQQ